MSRHAINLPPVSSTLIAPLKAALDLCFAITSPDAVIISGSLIKPPLNLPVHQHNPGGIDLVLLHNFPWQQRVQRRIANVPCSFYVNADLQLRQDLLDEAANGRPIMADMLHHGYIAYDPLGRAATLCTQARALLRNGWKPIEAELEAHRVFAIACLDDARECVAHEPVNAELQLARALEATIDYFFAARGQWLPRPKDRIQLLSKLDRGSAVLLEAVYLSYDLPARVRAAERLAERVLGARSFFEWVAPRESADCSSL